MKEEEIIALLENLIKALETERDLKVTLWLKQPKQKRDRSDPNLTLRHISELKDAIQETKVNLEELKG